MFFRVITRFVWTANTSPVPVTEITIPSVSVFDAVASGSDQVGVVVNGLPIFVLVFMSRWLTPRHENAV